MGRQKRRNFELNMTADHRQRKITKKKEVNIARVKNGWKQFYSRKGNRNFQIDHCTNPQ